MSSPGHFKQREAIRATWGNSFKHLTKNGHLVFQIGLSNDPFTNKLVKKEALKFKDILLQDFTEDYYNLTLKSVLLLKYLHGLKYRPEFVFKIDDDVFLNVPKFLKEFSVKKYLGKISGHVYHQIKPVRYAFINTEWAKWICPYWMYSQDVYPDFVAGPG